MAKRKQTNSVFRLLIIFLFAILCISLLGIIWGLDTIPRQAAQEFGVPSSKLGALQRLYISAQLFWYRADLTEPVKAGDAPVNFEISQGESVSSVSTRLADAGVIRNADAFRLYLIYSGMDTGLQAGTYQLEPGKNAMQVARSLQDATPGMVTLKIWAGWRLEEIAEAVSVSGLEISSNEFLAAARHPDPQLLPEGWPELSSLEGFIPPGTYSLDRKTDLNVLLQTFYSQFNTNLSDDIVKGIQNQGLDLFKAVTLASIVEKEAMVADEQPMIASVFYNRLAQGIKLDSDPTVQYSLGYSNQQKTWWKNPLSLDDLKTDSPYNTYIYAGFPPGPIGSVSQSALRAVAYPASSPYLYFRAKCDGSGRHEFATTFDEHVQNACP